MSLRPCLEPGCPELVRGRDSRCPKHAGTREHVYDQQRGSPAARGYDARHRAFRAVVLARDRICKACGRERSTYADHIIPLKQGGAKLYPRNGQGMCSRCDQVKRGQERHQ